VKVASETDTGRLFMKKEIKPSEVEERHSSHLND
jgi:hypothetical protein